jgi:adenylate kinase
MRDPSDPALAEAAQVILSGAFVPDEIANRLVLNRLDGGVGFVLDGFPRTVPQADALDRFLAANGVALNAAVLLDADDGVIDRRIGQRRVCPACGRSYDLKLSPPQDMGRCDFCGEELTLRPEEDTPEKAALRRRLYRERTGEVIEYYASSGRLASIDASGPPAAVEKAACDAVLRAV